MASLIRTRREVRVSDRSDVPTSRNMDLNDTVPTGASEPVSAEDASLTDADTLVRQRLRLFAWVGSAAWIIAGIQNALTQEDLTVTAICIATAVVSYVIARYALSRDDDAAMRRMSIVYLVVVCTPIAVCQPVGHSWTRSADFAALLLVPVIAAYLLGWKVAVWAAGATAVAALIEESARARDEAHRIAQRAEAAQADAVAGAAEARLALDEAEAARLATESVSGRLAVETEEMVQVARDCRRGHVPRRAGRHRGGAGFGMHGGAGGVDGGHGPDRPQRGQRGA